MATPVRLSLDETSDVISELETMKPTSAEASKLIANTIIHLEKHSGRFNHVSSRRGGYHIRQTLLEPGKTEHLKPGWCSCGSKDFADTTPYCTYSYIELPAIKAGITHQNPVLAELVAALHEALVLRAAGKEESLSAELVSSLERRLEHERPNLDAPLLGEELSSLGARLQETQGWVSPMERELTHLRARAKQLEAAVSELEVHLLAIEMSLLWRVIKAMRQLVHKLIG